MIRELERLAQDRIEYFIKNLPMTELDSTIK
jgi:hypothetical protein